MISIGLPLKDWIARGSLLTPRRDGLIGCRAYDLLVAYRVTADLDPWDAARAWARSGVMALKGGPARPPLLPPLGAPGKLDAVVSEIARLTASAGTRIDIAWEAALAGRAAILGLGSAGRTSANGSCRLMESLEGDVALNLPRDDDLALVAALTSDPSAEERPWEAAADLARSVPAAEFVSRARLLGLAASRPSERAPGHSYTQARRGPARTADAGGRWTVVDLSSLWAGPVTARVLAEAGASIVKVEDPARPDAARQRPEFYSWIHPVDETSAHVSFESASGRRDLRELLETADVVIESSRPRALEQMGLAPEQLRFPAGQIWLSITAHGRCGPPREWTGFGDDTAVAGGMYCLDADGRAEFCGDAIADPVTGLVGALAVLRCRAAGGGHHIDISLSGATAWVSGGGTPADHPSRQGIALERSGDSWVVRHGGRVEPVAAGPPTLEWICSTRRT